MKKSKSKSKKNVRSGFLVFMAAIVLGTMGIVLYLIRGGAGGKSIGRCGGTTPGSCPSGYDCMQDESTGAFKCVPPCTVDTCLDNCTIDRQYKKKPNFQSDFLQPTPNMHMEIIQPHPRIGGCNSVKTKNSTICNPNTEDCVQRAKKQCDTTPGCMSFIYYKDKDKAYYCPYVEYQNQKGITLSGHDFYYIDNVNDIKCSCEGKYTTNSCVGDGTPCDTKLCQITKA